MKLLRDYCTNVDDCYFLWIEIPHLKNHNLKLVISKGYWYTNCTSEQKMMGYKSKTNELKYFYVRLYEEQDIRTPLLSIRTDIDGRVGELVWLQKGQYCSGTDVLAVFHVLDTAIGCVLLYKTI